MLIIWRKRVTEMERLSTGRLKQGDKGMMDEHGKRRRILCRQLMKEYWEYVETWQTYKHTSQLVLHFILTLTLPLLFPTFLNHLFFYLSSILSCEEEVIQNNNHLRGNMLQVQTWGRKVFRKIVRFHLGYRGWHLNVVMNEKRFCENTSVKQNYPFSTNTASSWAVTMCVEEFVYSATPNRVLIAWDGFPLPFPHFLL